MTMLRTVKLAVVLGVAATFMVGLPPQVAQSQTAFQLWLMERQRIRRPVAPPVKIKRVSAPKFFTYSAPPLKRVDFSALVKLAEDAGAADVTQTGTIAEIQLADNQLYENTIIVSEIVRETVPEFPTDSSTQSTENSTVSNPLDEATDGGLREFARLPELENHNFFDASITLSNYQVSARSDVGKAVVEYYVANPEFFWLANAKPTFSALLALDILGKANEIGLSASDYQVQLPALRADAGELGRFEMKMSLMAVRYALDARNGKINPNKLSGYHDFPKAKYTATQAMTEITSSASPSAYLATANPDSKTFRLLRAELENLKDASTDIITIAQGTLIKPGKAHEELPNVVAAIRKKGKIELLQRHGETLTAYSRTPEFTDGLVALVKDFQRQAKLKPDGIVGRNTISKLVDVDPQVKMNRVRLAMERLRWHPRRWGVRHVFINQPEYRARYFEGGEEKLSMRAIVGKKSNQTSFFHDTIERVEYNPYWGVPQSIIINEMLPKLRANPSYLDNNGYEVTNLRGQKISSASIDWRTMGGGQVPLNVRQYPGRRNALGELKILFPNKHAIYMHDTPSRGLFKRNVRSLSHGCVRLQNPRGMAAAVLGTTVSHVGQRINLGKNNAQKLAAQIPVYVAYFTAWPNKDGVVKYFTDMYDRDRLSLKGNWQGDHGARGRSISITPGR